MDNNINFASVQDVCYQVSKCHSSRQVVNSFKTKWKGHEGNICYNSLLTFNTLDVRL